ncbi:MAG: hypothetical protein IPP45_16380 [Sphingomonadales bacterium]|nr:hypothetical protein [Sphingomonadales bacterium]
MRPVQPISCHRPHTAGQHCQTYLLATLIDYHDRALAIEPLTSDWIQTFFPGEFAKLQDIAGHGGMSLEDGIPLLAAEW